MHKQKTYIYILIPPHTLYKKKNRKKRRVNAYFTLVGMKAGGRRHEKRYINSQIELITSEKA